MRCPKFDSRTAQRAYAMSRILSEGAEIMLPETGTLAVLQ
jgi:hypothetical protein